MLDPSVRDIQECAVIASRVIRIPGEGLLPPSTDPLPPADLKHEECVCVVPPCPPWQPRTAAEVAAPYTGVPLPDLDTRYWRLEAKDDPVLRSLQYDWENPPLNPTWFGRGEGLDALPDLSIFRLRSAKKKISLPDFWKGANIFIAGPRLLDLLLKEDSEAIVHKPICFVSIEGEELSRDCHFVDVVRNQKAVDYANSVIDYVGGPKYEESETQSVSVSFVSARIVDDLSPSIQLFRQANLYGGGRGYFVTDQLRRKIEAVSPAIRNISFRPIYERF